MICTVPPTGVADWTCVMCFKKKIHPFRHSALFWGSFWWVYQKLLNPEYLNIQTIRVLHNDVEDRLLAGSIFENISVLPSLFHTSIWCLFCPYFCLSVVYAVYIYVYLLSSLSLFYIYFVYISICLVSILFLCIFVWCLFCLNFSKLCLSSLFWLYFCLSSVYVVYISIYPSLFCLCF